MLISRKWFDEVKRIGKQRCRPVGYALQRYSGAESSMLRSYRPESAADTMICTNPRPLSHDGYRAPGASGVLPPHATASTSDEGTHPGIL
jgi:hypothetical protein